MQIQVAKDLTDSAHDFLEFVWPAIKDLCGGGELVPVEAVTATEFARMIDILAGIDAWQVADGQGGMRGIASRVQWGHSWRTFTIRASRDSGARTEYEKRSWALEHQADGWLYPHLMSQGYVSEQRTGHLLSAAVARTADIFDFVRTEPELADWRQALRGRGWYRQRTSNAGFMVVPWDNFEGSGRWIGIVKPAARKKEAPNGKPSAIVQPFQQLGLWGV